MAEQNTYTGNVGYPQYTTAMAQGPGLRRGTYQALTSTELISKSVQWACFTKSPFLSVIGVEAFGVEAMRDLQVFGNARPNGRIIEYVGGKYAASGQVFATTPTSHHVGRLGNFTPELVEGGDEWAYSWHRLVQSEFIPDVDVQDNSRGLIDIKAQKMSGMKQKIVQDLNYCLLGHSSGPDYSSLGPSAVFSDLPNLISVDQTRTVCGIAASAGSYWQNQYGAITSIGGGGEMNRPLTLRRKLKKIHNDALKLAESGRTDDYFIVTSQGGWQYYDRLAYADSIQAGQKGAVGTVAKYDAAGIPNFAFNGAGMIWDGSWTVPYADSAVTAGTEGFYGIHIPSYKLSIRSEENFVVDGWEAPRAHDMKRTLVAQIRLRYTPAVIARRPHFVAYNVPACPD